MRGNLCRAWSMGSFRSMFCALFVDSLRHGLTFSRFSVLVVGECHHHFRCNHGHQAEKQLAFCTAAAAAA
jgi:hypothetical protein